MTKHKAGAIASVLAKCLQMSESSSWPMPSSFRWEARGSTRKCIFLFIEGEMRDVMVMKWDILGCGRCLTEAVGFFTLALISISFPWQQCTAVPALAPLNSFLPVCPLAAICISHGSKASALLRYLPSFPNYTLPSSISFLQFHSFKKKKICLLPSDINVTADMCFLAARLSSEYSSALIRFRHGIPLNP